MADLPTRPAWLPPDFIQLTEKANPALPIFVHVKAVVAVEDTGGIGGSLVNVVTRADAFEVTETPQQVFMAITKATA